MTDRECIRCPLSVRNDGPVSGNCRIDNAVIWYSERPECRFPDYKYNSELKKYQAKQTKERRERLVAFEAIAHQADHIF